MVVERLVASFRQSAKLQQHVRFLYAKGSVYHIENGNLLYHGAVPMTAAGTLPPSGLKGGCMRAVPDGLLRPAGAAGLLCPEDSPARRSARTFLWYLWCGKLSPPVWAQRHDHLLSGCMWPTPPPMWR